MSIFFERNEAFSKKHNKRLLTLCEPLFCTFGVRKFFYQYTSNDGGFNFLGTHTELMDYYFERELHHATPFMTQFESLQTGLYMMNSVKNSKYQTALQAVEEKFKIKHSFSLVKNDGKFCHQFGFYIPSDQQGVEALLLNEMAMIKSFIAYFESEMAFLIRKLHQDPIDMKALVGKLYGQKAHGLPNLHLQASQRKHILAKMTSAKELLAHYNLTVAEIECLGLILAGKSCAEMAKYLHRSARTIEHRLESIKEKLHCRTKSELFSRLQKMPDLQMYTSPID
jgi:DNA-binding CsgD family transcriptional regulator